MQEYIYPAKLDVLRKPDLEMPKRKYRKPPPKVEHRGRVTMRAS